MKATPQQQQDLLVLADTDQELRRLEHSRANLPEQQLLDEHVEIREKVADELAEAASTQERLAAQVTRHEREIETADAGRKHSEEQIYSGRITSERELGALRDEIQDKERRKADLEDSLLEIMEQVEEVESLIEELTSRRSELTDQIAHLTSRRDEAARDIDAELEQLRARRDEEAAGLDDGVLSAYDQLAAARKGRVVSRLEGRSCTACRLELTAMDIEEVKAAAQDSLARCPQCGVIIVPPPRRAAAEAEVDA